MKEQEDMLELIKILGQRIDQIWEFLEVAGIAKPIEREE